MGSDGPSLECTACKFCNGECGQACICCTTCSIACLHSSSSLWWSWEKLANNLTSPQSDSPSSDLWGLSRGLCTLHVHSKGPTWQWCNSPRPSPTDHGPEHWSLPDRAQLPVACVVCSAERHRSGRETKWCPTCRELAATSKNHCGTSTLPSQW